MTTPTAEARSPTRLVAFVLSGMLLGMVPFPLTMLLLSERVSPAEILCSEIGIVVMLFNLIVGGISGAGLHVLTRPILTAGAVKPTDGQSQERL